MPRKESSVLATLEAAGMLNEEQRLRIERELLTTKKSIRAILIDMGIVSKEASHEVLELLHNAPFVRLSSYILNPEAVLRIPENLARKYKAIVVDSDGDTLSVAMADPFDILALDDLKAVTECKITPLMAEEADIENAISRYYNSGMNLAEEAVKLGESGEDGEPVGEGGSEDLRIDDLKNLGEQAPVIEMVNQIILKAVTYDASDIHVEPVKDGLLVRFRVDGILQDSVSIPRSARAAIISRVKIMSKMDIAEKRLPQDGRFQAKVANRQIDFRVSTLPGIHGEKVVIRLLDTSKGVQHLSKLGMEQEDYERLLELIKKTTGICIVTGPTGSGKTSTLYSILDAIKSPQKNIITIEDPVEYQLERIYQVQVNTRIGMDFANILRSVLRQDPDIIMLGEIRDTESAELAIRAALTGHLVVSTLHTNDAAQAITRSVDMGLNPYLIAATYNGVISQRLVRKLCDNCKKPIKPSNDVLASLGHAAETLRGKEVYEAGACPYCENRGYKGRTGVFEILAMGSRPMKDLILSGASARELFELAKAETGASSLLENALKKVLRGETTLEEVIRVAF
jgi:type IV pilus assembly protein PilB